MNEPTPTPKTLGRPRISYAGTAGKFGEFVTQVHAENIATEVGVDPTAVYQWMRGEASPRPITAFALVALARRAGMKLTLEDIYFREAKEHKKHEERSNEKNKSFASA